jgi:hypothetical protein
MDHGLRAAIGVLRMSFPDSATLHPGYVLQLACLACSLDENHTSHLTLFDDIYVVGIRGVFRPIFLTVLWGAFSRIWRVSMHKMPQRWLSAFFP